VAIDPIGQRQPQRPQHQRQRDRREHGVGAEDDQVDGLGRAGPRVAVRARGREPDQVAHQEHRRASDRGQHAPPVEVDRAPLDRDPTGDHEHRRGAVQHGVHRRVHPGPGPAGLGQGRAQRHHRQPDRQHQPPEGLSEKRTRRSARLTAARRRPSRCRPSAGRRSTPGTPSGPSARRRATGRERPAPRTPRPGRGRDHQVALAAHAERVEQEARGELHQRVHDDLDARRGHAPRAGHRDQAGAVVVLQAVQRDRVEVRDLPEEQHGEHREPADVDGARSRWSSP
jgi:hypothetical protein